jgi:predicted porin
MPTPWHVINPYEIQSMRKTLVALPVLVACGAALAQSSVTIYGVLDIHVGKVKGGKWGVSNGEGYVLPAASNVATAAKDGFNSTTVLGFRGSEDLGGGLRANFNLQTGGFDLSTGSTALAFSRESWVGLESSSLGAVQFGRSASLAAKVMGPYDLNGNSYSSAFANSGLSSVLWYGTSRRSDQIQYATPNMSGVVVRAAYTAKGDASPNGVELPATARGSLSGGATYQVGKLSVSAFGESKKSSAPGARAAYAAGVMYDLSVVKVSATFNRRELGGHGQNVGWNSFKANGFAGGGGKGFTLGAQAPVSVANIGFQIARNTDTKVNAYEVYGNYALSKRTRLYVDFGKTTGVNASAAIAPTATLSGSNAVPRNPYVLAAGIVHTF